MNTAGQHINAGTVPSLLHTDGVQLQCRVAGHGSNYSCRSDTYWPGQIWSNFAENNVDFVACCLCGVNIKRGRKNKIFKKQKRLPDRESNPGLPRLKH